MGYEGQHVGEVEHYRLPGEFIRIVSLRVEQVE